MREKREQSGFLEAPHVRKQTVSLKMPHDFGQIIKFGPWWLRRLLEGTPKLEWQSPSFSAFYSHYCICCFQRPVGLTIFQKKIRQPILWPDKFLDNFWTNYEIPAIVVTKAPRRNAKARTTFFGLLFTLLYLLLFQRPSKGRLVSRSWLVAATPWARATKNVKKPQNQMCDSCRKA